MKSLKIGGILLIVLALSAMIATSVMADAPYCKNQSYDFVHSHTLEFSPGAWSVGTHEYWMRIAYNPGSFEKEIGPLYFNVDENASLYPGQVFVRFFGLTWLEGATLSIHPDQDTVMQLSWVYEKDMTARERNAFQEDLIVEFKWDGGAYVTVPAGPVISLCTEFNHGFFFRTWGGSWR